MQLSGARSTTELIARRVGLPLGARYAKMSNQNTQQALALSEKEVIQPQLPVRLPCYDFTPVTSLAVGIPLLAVKVMTSGMASSHSVTGGHKRHDDLTSSSPSSSLSPVVCSGFQTQRWQLNMRVALVAGLNPTPYATALHGSIRTAPSIHRLRLGLLGYLIPFTPLAFVSQCQCQPSRVLSPLVFFPISTHFTVPPEIPSAPTVLQLDALRPIIPDNACILYITAVAGTELADAYSPNTSLLLLQENKFTTRGPSTSTRHCSVSLSPIAKNSPLLPPVGVWAVSQSQCADHPLGPAIDHRLDKAGSELSFIPRHNLYLCASYSLGVRSQKYSHPYPSRQSHKPLIHSYSITGEGKAK
ncbi:hypothetical protein PVK06_047582 [Gossypium arboreum]|uniref:Uncharacterized protein n=1 Tax=Gossypium arboreum TaxID=29729 RepID=A0ABR0MFL4_GOSAR|nr:hypothetical protein PVK06_047582 [Gossypium arboreum]